MTILTEEINDLTVMAEDAGIPLSRGVNNLAEDTYLQPHKMCTSVQQARKEKILAIRHQIAEDRYELDERLDAILDQLLAILTT